MFRLAQINIAKLLAPIYDPLIAGFVAQIDAVNSLAEQAPGFIWTYESPEGERGYCGDPMVVVNMSVWESVEALKDFTYKSHHVDVFRRKAQWFEKALLASYCLWWIPVGHEPTLAEGSERLEYLRAHGPTCRSFTFASVFPPLKQ